MELYDYTVNKILLVFAIWSMYKRNKAFNTWLVSVTPIHFRPHYNIQSVINV